MEHREGVMNRTTSHAASYCVVHREQTGTVHWVGQSQVDEDDLEDEEDRDDEQRDPDRRDDPVDRRGVEAGPAEHEKGGRRNDRSIDA